ncbi:ThiF family adenylyltransferase [Arthrobacter castelli]|uniref:ThiF family adenylyltransferase n=1 Tax=Arthrobacter castelli TaxID=271431 RepID=UPI0003FB7374|nr:ThiF family adenylyltransferase [Arthrobacter castelli]
MHINRRLQMFERSGHCVQFGVGEQSIVLDGLTDPDKKLLWCLMDGTNKSGSMLASECGLLPARAQYLMELLDPVLIHGGTEASGLSGLRSDRLGPDVEQWSAAYEQDAVPLMERRSRAAVRIAGLGRTGSVIAQALAAAGIGTLLLEDAHRVRACDVGAGSYRLCDIGMGRTAAVRRQIHHIDPTIRAHPLGTAHAGGTGSFSLDLVISISSDVTDDRLQAELMHREHPHLPVVLRDHDVLIGPLVVPGETACTECVDRHRADQDPQWLNMCRTMRRRAMARDSTGPEESALALSAAGPAVLQSLLLVDGVNRPSGWSTVVQVRAADGSTVTHSYSPHPDCGCLGATASVPAVS